MKTLMFKEKEKQTLLPMKVLNSIKLKYFCTSL